MPDSSDLDQLAQQYQIAGDRVVLALWRLALKANPNWHLQPRVPAGQTGGGRWVSVGAVAGAIVPVIARIVTEVVKEAVRQVAKRLPDILRRTPKPWGLDPVPDPKDKDLKHERIGPPTQRRPDVPYVQFRNFDEFKRYAGPAGPGRQWHHIVEQRLVLTGRFRPESIHNTDNIISVPRDAHQWINGTMSRRDPKNGYPQLRFYVETLSYPEQYNHGLKMIRDAYKALGYLDGN